MKALNSLLPILAVLLASLLAFQLGSRFGSKQTGAIALASQLDYLVQLSSQPGIRMQEEAQEAFLERFDYLVAMACEQRTRWYLGGGTREALDGAVARGLRMRGDALVERFEFSGQALAKLVESGAVADRERYLARLAELRAAILRAREDLASDAPSPE